MADGRALPRILSSALLGRLGFVHGFTIKGGNPSDLGVDEGTLYLVSQVHGSAVARAHGPPSSLRSEQADAIVLEPGQAGAVRVADCVPVLVADDASGRAAVIHAGWRGVASGVVPAAVAALRARPGGLVAAIGPCIGLCCFEVGVDVADQITFAVPAPGVEAHRQGDKAWVDLTAAVRAQLEACGVPAASVEKVGGCTQCDASLYESFRRDGKASGRMLGVIAGRATRAA